MAEGRRRPTRWLWVVLFALLLWLLLQLNQFLPGVWPGGGTDKGLRPSPAGTSRDPSRLKPSDAPIAPTKPSGPTSHVVVRMPDGSPKADGEIRVTRREGNRWHSERHATNGAEGARLEWKDGEALREFGAVEAQDRVFAHGAPPADAGREWVVQLPRAPSPALVDAAPGTRPTVRVVAGDGTPLAGATVEVQAGRREWREATKADGTASFDLQGVYRACAHAPGFGEACAYGSASSQGPLVVTLRKIVTISTRFVDAVGPTAAPISARALRLVGADGTIKVLEREGGEFADFETTLPTDVAARTSLEVEVAGRPLLRVPLGTVRGDTAVPAGRVVRLTVRDEAGTPRASARVEVRYAATSVKEPTASDIAVATFRTDALGRADLPLPEGAPADVRVEIEGFAPAGLAIAATAAAEAEVVVARGLTVSVVVRDAEGRPISGADVLAIVRAGDAPARRTARTGADGTASLEAHASPARCA